MISILHIHLHYYVLTIPSKCTFTKLLYLKSAEMELILYLLYFCYSDTVLISN